jgi:hypothetical protein
MRNVIALAGGWLLLAASSVSAGMPAPLPTNPRRELLRIDEPIMVRIQDISFFFLCFLLCAFVVKLLWNYLQRDFSWLPRLSFPTALAGVCMWGLLFVIVLTMISGARELMTPKAWKKEGFTYTLASENNDASSAAPQEPTRRQHLEKLRTALWHFAATHNGNFPQQHELTAISEELWLAPDAGGLRYQYVPGQTAGHLPRVLVYEPEIDSNHRLVLKTNGDILTMPSTELQIALNGGPQ